MIKSTGFARVICAIAFFLVSRQIGFGQATGSIAGTVSDLSGAAVSGAKVTIQDPATGSSRQTSTDNTGHYIVPLLGVAKYTVSAEAPGFALQEVKDVDLQTNQQRELDLTLSPASLKQTVEVEAAPVAIETANPTLGQVITSQQVAELPLNKLS